MEGRSGSYGRGGGRGGRQGGAGGGGRGRGRGRGYGHRQQQRRDHGHQWSGYGGSGGVDHQLQQSQSHQQQQGRGQQRQSGSSWRQIGDRAQTGVGRGQAVDAVASPGGYSGGGSTSAPAPAPAPAGGAFYVRGGGESSGSREEWKAAATTSSPAGNPDPPVIPVKGSDTDKSVPPKRPDSGGTSAVRTTRLLVNHFSVKYNSKSIIWEYDVDVKPEMPPSGNGRSVRICKADLRLIRNQLFSDGPLDIPLSKTAYDGDKKIFSAVELPRGSFKVEVSKGEGAKLRSYMVTLKPVKDHRLGRLAECFTRRGVTSIPRDILQGMDLVMKENPTRKMISVGRSFYPAKHDDTDDLGRGIAAFRGFQHSLKPTCQGLAMCLDSSVLAFRKPLEVIDYLTQHLPGFNKNDMRSFRRDAVEASLKGLKVYVTHRRTKQKYTIRGLTKEITRNLTFEAEDPDGKEPPKKIWLLQYFKDKYDKDLEYKNIPCLDLGKNGKRNDVPMELCVLVEGQRFQKENLGENAASRLKRMSLAKPNIRQDMICKKVRSEDGPCGGDIAQNFGIQVDMNMTRVKGRIIRPPELKLGTPDGKITKITVDKEKCQWNLVRKSVVEGKRIQRWAVLEVSSPEQSRLDRSRFIPKFINRCNGLGIKMEEPLFYERTSMGIFNDVDLLRKLLESVYDKAESNLQILLCVISGKAPGYKHLKWISETQIGIVTQCCLTNRANQAEDQYLANLGLKLNAKLGGCNVELIERLPLLDGAGHVMFLGADVNHPGSFTISPSIAAVVGSMNWPAANHYAARVRPQEHRCENIKHFGDMCWELVEAHVHLNKVKPEKIVLFRDGVSDGQFDMVLNEELSNMKSVFESKGYSPSITLIVAQKRHQTRLFPESYMDGGRTGNVAPGTVVDTAIVHPFEYDFYLCSHYGSIGTSKPTHYYVLRDDHEFTSDQLQKLIYDMCFTMARCTKPVSLVPPVYYADLAAYRGRIYYEAMVEQSPTSGASSSSLSVTSSSQTSTASMDEKFCRLHTALENDMFFI